MSGERVVRKRRNLPHWTVDGSVYFVTFRAASGILNEDERAIVLDHIRSGEGEFYLLAAAVIMPDHAHIVIKPKPPYELSHIMKGIKGVSARRINTIRQATGSLWQDESWDRIVRDAEEFDEKAEYMMNNPVKAGLVLRAEDYPFWYFNLEFH